MEYRQLGRWGVRVSVIGLGSYLTIGHHVDTEEGRRIIERAYEGGVNFFDTANAYNLGEAEKALGQYLKPFGRSSFVLASKVFAPMGKGPNDRGLSRKHVFEQCDASLKRLGTDYMDLYQCHRYDAQTPLEETIHAMDDLIHQGKILYWGVSEWTALQIGDACTYCERWGLNLPVSNQPRYSLLWRYPEKEVFPLCQAKGLGQVVFSPLAHGVLSGKYIPGAPIPEGTRAADASQNEIMMNLYFKEEILSRVQEMKRLAGEMSVATAQLAVAWILRRSTVSSVITGATRLEQLDDNLKAAEIKVPDEVAARMEELFPVPDQQLAAP
ncbi:MAG: aldo/keto reductase [Luteitalea sp.]|nr:aldo/keto reductase [Luteitalea sp.]